MRVEVDYVIANGVTYDRTNNKWSDLNADNYHAVQGENVITLVDTAGNKTSFTFELDDCGAGGHREGRRLTDVNEHVAARSARPSR